MSDTDQTTFDSPKAKRSKNYTLIEDSGNEEDISSSSDTPPVETSIQVEPEVADAIHLEPVELEPMADAYIKSLRGPLEPFIGYYTELGEEQDKLIKACKEQQESVKLVQNDIDEIDAKFQQIPEYLAKITRIQRNMFRLEDKISSLKERTNILKEKKERQIEKERQLKAKPAANLKH
eukprot:TRINITY_DN9712_c0_g1_i1.p1 TRINITY_DN9712_c0_g1~~TRINITY_DN9712_c0_g1_i1.p1  ORF type:complete len:178 (-),score=46.18 TRINITY_DN9712_c0_g1_i1:8-541(-)